MVDDYQQEYVKFLAEIQKIDDATDAKFERLDLGSNVVLIFGQIIGTDTRKKNCRDWRAARFTSSRSATLSSLSAIVVVVSDGFVFSVVSSIVLLMMNSPTEIQISRVWAEVRCPPEKLRHD